MNVQNATPDMITDRIATICLLLPEFRKRIETVQILEDDDLIAVWVLPGEKATRRQLTLGTPSLYEVTRDYIIYAIVTRSKGNSEEEELEAVKAAYPYENELPSLFISRPQLQLNGNDGIVFKIKPLSDDGPVLAPISKNSALFGMWKYTMPVVTMEYGA